MWLLLVVFGGLNFVFFFPLWWLFLVVVVVVVFGGGFGDLSCGFFWWMWFARFDLSCGFGAFFVGFFCGCSSGEVVGFGWWLCGVLGLFTTMRSREGRKRDRN